jgi:hypothetical protein
MPPYALFGLGQSTTDTSHSIQTILQTWVDRSVYDDGFRSTLYSQDERAACFLNALQHPG